MPRRRIPPALTLAFATFVVFGLPDGVFGTIWPTQRADLGRSIGDLSWVVSGGTVGYLLATPASGHLTARWGTGRMLLAALAGSAAGIITMGAAPSFGVLVVAAAFFGAAAGTLDSVVNAWVAARHGTRAMGFLHAFFGVGAALGAPYAAGAIGHDVSWRTVLVLLGVAELLLAALAWLRRRDYDTPPPADRTTVPSPGSRRLLILSLLWFYLVVGIEVSVGSWGYSLLFEERGVSSGVAALWVAGFWAAFTGGRVLLGVVGERAALLPTLWASLGLAGLGAAMLWARIGGWALPVIGLGVATLFPAMVVLTPRWLGTDRAGLAMGYQLAAASLGAVTFAIGIGRLADRWDLEILGPFLGGAVGAAALVLFAMGRTVAAPQPVPH